MRRVTVIQAIDGSLKSGVVYLVKRLAVDTPATFGGDSAVEVVKRGMQAHACGLAQ